MKKKYYRITTEHLADGTTLHYTEVGTRNIFGYKVFERRSDYRQLEDARHDLNKLNKYYY